MRAIHIPMAITGAVLTALFLSRDTREDAEDNGASELSRVFLPTGTVTPADMRIAAERIRIAGGDLELALALEDTASMREREVAELPREGVRVYCRAWSLGQFYAGPSIFTAYVDAIDRSEMLIAVQRTLTGWTRVVVRKPQGLVLDPTAGERTGWIRTDELTLTPTGKAPGAVIRGAPQQFARIGSDAEDFRKFRHDARSFGAWVESPMGMTVMAAGASLSAEVFPPLAVAIGVFVVVVHYMNQVLDVIDTVEETLRTAVQIFDGNFSIAKIYKLGIYYQGAIIGQTYDAMPELVRNVGLTLPPDANMIGEKRQALSKYMSAAYMSPIEAMTSDKREPFVNQQTGQIDFRTGSIYKDIANQALSLAKSEGLDLDVALTKAGMSPATFKVLSRVATKTGPLDIPAREDAIALAANALVNKTLYSPDWYDAASGSMTQDRAQLRMLMAWEYTRATVDPEATPETRKLHLERLRILERAYEVAPRGRLRHVTVRAVTDPPSGADQLRMAWLNAQQIGMNARTVNALHAQFLSALKRELDSSVAEQTKYAERRAAVANATASFSLSSPASREAYVLSLPRWNPIVYSIVPDGGKLAGGPGPPAKVIARIVCPGECYVYAADDKSKKALYSAKAGTEFDFQGFGKNGFARVVERQGERRTVYILADAITVADRRPEDVA